MDIDSSLLVRFLRDYPFQPATAFWRALEIDHIVTHPFPTGRGLDLGCGDGKVMEIILEKTGRRELVGVDIDSRETAEASQRGIYQKIHAVPADAIPEKNATFDFVFSNSVLEHIPAIDPVIREAARVLKPGGIFLFTVPGDGFHHCLRGPLLPWVSRSSYLETLDRRVAHLRYFSVEDWKRHLGACGLEVEWFTAFLNEAQTRRWETLARFTAGVLYALWGKRKSPLEIQLALRLPKATAKTPMLLARFLSAIILWGIQNETEQKKHYGNYMIQSRKKSS